MPYWRLYYHIVWTTWRRLAFITAEIEAPLHNYLVQKSRAMGCYIFAVNGTEDHIHIVSAIPPHLSVAEFVRNIKGSSSHFVTQQFAIDFMWEKGYGVVTVSRPRMKDALNYVRRQKEHHCNGTTILALETCSGSNDGPQELQ